MIEVEKPKKQGGVNSAPPAEKEVEIEPIDYPDQDIEFKNTIDNMNGGGKQITNQSVLSGVEGGVLASGGPLPGNKPGGGTRGRGQYSKALVNPKGHVLQQQLHPF